MGRPPGWYPWAVPDQSLACCTTVAESPPEGHRANGFSSTWQQSNTGKALCVEHMFEFFDFHHVAGDVGRLVVPGVAFDKAGRLSPQALPGAHFPVVILPPPKIPLRPRHAPIPDQP